MRADGRKRKLRQTASEETAYQFARFAGSFGSNPIRSPGLTPDRNLESSQTVNPVRRLRANGVYFEELIYPDEIHDFLRHQDWLRAYHAAADLFDKHLK